jgi:hypothetical protein
MGHRLHSNLNGALNVVKKAISKTPITIKKPKWHPLKRGGNNQNPTKPHH